MATSYPGGYDSLPRPTASDTMDDTAGGLSGPQIVDNLSDAVEAVQAELGLDPAGAYATVAAYLLDLDARLGVLEGAQTVFPLYGTTIGADSLGNMQIGGPASGGSNTWVSERFRAAYGGTITKVRPFIVPAVAPYIPGYAGGTGGTIRISIEEDDGSGYPIGWYASGGSRQGTGSPLAYYDASGTELDDATDRFREYTFSTAADVVAGELYHLCFSNIDAAPTTNYVSADFYYQYSPTTPRQPISPDTDYGAVRKIGSNAWTDTANNEQRYTPLLDITYGSGDHQGIGYVGVSLTDPQIISTTSMVRERFTPTSNLVVTGAGVRIAKTSGTGDLTVRLEESDGTLIDSFTASTSGVSTLTRGADAAAGQWVSGSFASSQALTAGLTYNLRLSTDGSTSLWSRPLQQGSAYGYNAATYFSDGVMQYTTNSGSTWTNVLTGQGDLQFYLDS